MKFLKALFILSIGVALVGCTSDQKIKEQVAKALKEDPKILAEAIENNPAEIIDALQKAARSAQEGLAKKRDEEEKKKLEESFDKPLVAKIRDDEAIRGTKGAPITVVEYTDFECPFCSRGFETVNQLLTQYNGKIQFVLKHLPLSFHEQAMPAAQYYEAIRLQDPKKAFAFHDEVFKNQRKLKNGKAFLDATAKQVGADMAKLKKDVDSESVKARIEEDMKEAADFGMQGTPGFLVNGVPVRGAYPIEHFNQIIEELKKRGKLSL